MEKIRELLGKIGASDELANHLCEELDVYTKSLKVHYEGILKERIGVAKKLCVEEVQREKVNLARKVGTFLESKANSVENAMTRQRVAEESEATSILKRQKALLEDIKIDESGSSRELLALQKKSGRMEKAISTLREERDRAVQKANKANEIAIKFLDRNKLYEGKLVAAGLLSEAKGGGSVCECGTSVGEGISKCPSCGKAVVTGKEKKAAEKVAEGKLPPEFLEQQKKAKGKGDGEDKDKDGEDKKPPIGESKKPKSKAKRLDESRDRASKPKSTRRSLVESVAQRGKAVLSEGGGEINKIADEMPDF